jgi:hypothetical protein
MEEPGFSDFNTGPVIDHEKNDVWIYFGGFYDVHVEVLFGIFYLSSNEIVVANVVNCVHRKVRPGCTTRSDS